MNSIQKEVQRLFLPLLRYSPILMVCVGVAVVLALRSVQYAVPMYESSASIRIGIQNERRIIDEKKSDVSPSLTGEYVAAGEVLQSRSLREQALKRVDFDIDYFRVGTLVTRDMYHDSPFRLNIDVLDKTKVYDKAMYLVYKGDGVFQVASPFCPSSPIKINTIHETPSARLTIRLDTLLKKDALQPGDKFKCVVNSMKSLIEKHGGKRIFIKLGEKESPVLKVYYQNEVPEKAQSFLNALTASFIENQGRLDSSRNSRSLERVTQQFEQVSSELREKEKELADYKIANGVSNLTIQSEIALRTDSELESEMRKLNQKAATLQDLSKYLDDGKYMNVYAPNLEVLQDGFYRESMVKLQNMEIERSEKLKRFTANSDEIRKVDEKITYLKATIEESVANTLKSLTKQKTDLQKSTNLHSQSLTNLPKHERTLLGLMRDVAMKERVYNELAGEYAALLANQNAATNYHQMVDYPTLPEKPVSPNKALTVGIFGFVGLLIGLLLVFLANYWLMKINAADDIAQHTSIPLFCTLNHPDDIANIGIKLLSDLPDTTKTKGKKVWIGALNDANNPLLGEKVALWLVNSDYKVILIQLSHYVLSEVTLGVPQTHLLENTFVFNSNIPNFEVLPFAELQHLSTNIAFSKRIRPLIEEATLYYDFVILEGTPQTAFTLDFPQYDADANLYYVPRNVFHPNRLHDLEKHLSSHHIPHAQIILGAPNHASFFNIFAKIKKIPSLFLGNKRPSSR